MVFEVQNTHISIGNMDEMATCTSPRGHTSAGRVGDESVCTCGHASPEVCVVGLLLLWGAAAEGDDDALAVGGLVAVEVDCVEAHEGGDGRAHAVHGGDAHLRAHLSVRLVRDPAQRLRRFAVLPQSVSDGLLRHTDRHVRDVQLCVRCANVLVVLRGVLPAETVVCRVLEVAGQLVCARDGGHVRQRHLKLAVRCVVLKNGAMNEHTVCRGIAGSPRGTGLPSSLPCGS